MNRLGAAFAAFACVTLLSWSDESAAEPAGNGWVTEQTIVSYADLDVNSPAGAEILLRRIRNAAERVCDVEDGERDLSRRVRAAACMREAIHQAVDRANLGRMQAIYTAPEAARHHAAMRRTRVRIYGDDLRIVVPYVGYDLSNASGREVISRRFERAARRACREDYRKARSARACVRELVSEGEVQIAAAAARQSASNPTAVREAASAAASDGAVAGNALAIAPSQQTDFGVCAPRNLSAAFEGSSASLSRAERNAVAYAVDRASVCQLSAVRIAVAGTGDLARRRAHALRAVLVGRGIPAEQIEVILNAPLTQPEVRMAFSGVAMARSTSLAGAEAAS